MTYPDMTIALCKKILQSHFGITRDGAGVCAKCDDPWPCDAALLAQEVQIQALAK